MKKLNDIICDFCLKIIGSYSTDKPKKRRRYYKDLMLRHKKDCTHWNDLVCERFYFGPNSESDED